MSLMLPALSEALRQRDFTTAVSLARQEVERDPQDAGIQHALGMALQGLGEIDAARAAYEKAIELAPDRAVPQMSLAHLDISQQRLEQAEAGIQSALQADPNHLEAYVALVHLALARGDNELAAKHLKYAQRVDDEDADVLVAEAHVAQFSGRAEQVIQCLTAAVTANPKHALGQASLGFAYLRQGHLAFAEQALRNARELQPSNYGVQRALVESLRRQKKGDEMLAALDDLLLHHPQQHGMRMLRAEVRTAAGDRDGAISDLLELSTASPAHPQVLAALTQLLWSKGEYTAAIAHVESALSAQPNEDANWNLRVTLTAHDRQQTGEVLRRWREAMPESGPAMEAQAQFLEQIGDLENAEILADKVLAKAEGAMLSQFIKLRSELRRDAKSALKRLVRLEAAAKAPEALRMVHSWKGYANYLTGDFEASGAAFRAMLQHTVPMHHLPRLFDAAGASTGESSGVVLWAPCGLRMEPILHALAPVLGSRLMAERNTASARQDGFGHLRMPPGDVDGNGLVQGDATSWRSALLQRGVDPETVVDWQPHWDAYTAEALAGSHLLALLMDPRDAFLNWVVFGSAQGFVMYSRTEVNARWLADVYTAVADTRERQPGRVTVCVMDNMPQDAESIAKQLQAALATEHAPSSEMIGTPIMALGGIQASFPAGTWRHYRDTFGEEFDLLTPVAQRLGYPAE